MYRNIESLRYMPKTNRIVLYANYTSTKERNILYRRDTFRKPKGT